MLSGSSIWLGQHVESVVFNIGDFGAVRGNVTADVFKKKEGFFAYISSVELLLFGSRIEFLHRLKAERKEEIENMIAAQFKGEWDDR